MKKLYDLLIPIVIITNISLLYFINKLPEKLTTEITKSLNIPVKDTVIVNTPDKLIKKGSMVYFSGETINEGVKLSDRFQYNPNYPNEFWDGYLTLCEFSSGSKYFVWSNFLPKKGEKLDGWFVSIDGTWQNEDDFLPVLIPVVEREKKEIFEVY